MAKTWLFDLVHYPYDVEPENFDPAKAAKVYETHLAEWERAEELGFDGLFLGEHHFTAYSLLPSPNVLLGAVSQRVKRMRVGIMINVLPFHQPLRLAEEIAMLDLLTGGRLECGLGRGVDAQEFMRLAIPMDEARPRFTEGLDLMLKAWTSDQFEHHGEFFQIAAKATIYPRPLQKPHPPIWITALSPQTIEWTASQGYPMSSIFLPTPKTKEAFDSYNEAAQEAGQTPGPEKLTLARNVYVADSEQQAIEEAGPAFNHLFGLFTEAALPSAKAVNQDLDHFYAGDEYAYYRTFFRPFVGQDMTFQDIRDAGLLVLGTPDQVRDQLMQQLKETGCGQFMAWMHFGNLAPDHVRRSQELYARDVMPSLRTIN